MENFLTTHVLDNQVGTRMSTGVTASIPRDLAAMLLQQDSNSYSNGFLRFVSPEDFQHYFSMWGLNPAECFPFIKFAFGHLVFYYQSYYRVLNPVYNCIDILGEEGELDFVMDVMLCDRAGLENSFFVDIYEQTLPRLGIVNLREIYAFLPAIGLGGSRDALSVRKVDMDKEMMILSQI